MYGTAMSVRFEMRVDDELMARIEAERGAIPRAAWIKLAIEQALGNGSAEAARESVKRGSEVAQMAPEVPWADPKPLPPRTGEKHVCPTPGCKASYEGPGAKCTRHDKVLVPINERPASDVSLEDF